MSVRAEPPHSVAAEQAVLGCVLLDPAACRDLAAGLQPEDFYRPDHRLIAQAIAAVARDSLPDVALIIEQLTQAGKLDEAGGAAYLRTLVRDTPTAANASLYAEHVRTYAARRRLLEYAANPTKPEELQAALERELAALRGLGPKQTQRLPRLVSFDDYTVRPKITWHYRDLLPSAGILLTFGAPKSGKTHIVVDMTMHAAHGMHWHGHALSRPLKVAYLAGEGHTGLRVRLHAWRRLHATEMKGDMRVMPEALSLAARLDDVLELLRPYGPDLIVTDTLNAYFGGLDENSTQDMTAFVAAVRRLRDELEASIVVIHHTGLADATRERGSSVLRGAADVIAQVARDEGGSGNIGFQVIEARDMEPWDEPISLHLAAAGTDWADEEGIAITTCLVQRADEPVKLPGRGGRPLGEAQKIVLEIARQLARERANGAAEVTVPRCDIAVQARERGVSKQSISSAWEPLHNRKLITLVQPASVIVKAQK
jgi:hypothetical protein